ncbi:MAG: hypothetical protein JWP69_956 [Flaviaesturariibacter sp.]|nr:hypothetical protein [Flaviaesturariibacter sp.]
MKENLKDILSNLNPEIDNEELLRYVQGHLPAEKQHELEARALQSDFEADALEGLQAFEDKRQLSHLVEQLNQDLKKKAGKRKHRLEPLQIKSDPWIWIAVAMILILVIISYIVIRANVKM